MDLCWQSDVFIFFNTLSRFVIVFFPRSKHLLISWLQSLSAVILEPKKIKSVTVSIVSPSICHEVMGPDAMIFIFWMLNFKPAFHSPHSPSSIDSLVPVRFLPLEWLSSTSLRLSKFLLEILIPVCESSSPAFHMMNCAYKLNKQGGKIQAWYSPFPILKQSVVPCPVLTVAFSPDSAQFWSLEVGETSPSPLQ